MRDAWKVDHTMGGGGGVKFPNSFQKKGGGFYDQ